LPIDEGSGPHQINVRRQSTASAVITAVGAHLRSARCRLTVEGKAKDDWDSKLGAPAATMTRRRIWGSDDVVKEKKIGKDNDDWYSRKVRCYKKMCQLVSINPMIKNALVSCIMHHASRPFHSVPFINHKCMQAFQGSESVRPVSSTNLGVPILYKNASRINDHPQTL
jgi:hypothetical protein